ncbi:MAG: hypothetical protein NW237_09485 [Cyanobacteriota bacterium]|nr:hypothetical protein [Cyanobacteriota bacterium]
MLTKIAEFSITDQEIEASRLFRFAKTKLLEDGTPLLLKAVSYLRLCCRGVWQLSELMPWIQLDNEWAAGKEVSFPVLLSELCQSSPEWWQQCWVSDRGILRSDNAEIDKLFQPLGYFVEMFVYE